MALLLAMPGHVAANETATMQTDTRLRFGGCGGLYLLAEPGELWIDLEKRDLHDGRRDTPLRAILVGPDRRPRDEAVIARNGTIRLRTSVDQKGVFAVNVTVSRDRYGERVSWGFATNCRHYLIETSRGHRDARHMEPIVLCNPQVSGNVCFLPRTGAFQIEVSDLPVGSSPLEVYDERDTPLGTLAVDEDGNASAVFEADERRGASPWRLHLPVWRAHVHIDGVTRWQGDDRYPNLSLWSTRADSYFPFPEHRWLLTPYHQTFYASPGQSQELTFRLHNNATRPDTVAVQAKPLSEWRVDTVESVTLAPGASKTISVHCQVPRLARTGQPYHARITVTSSLHPQMTTYATITGRIGTPPFAERLELPLVYRPYEHENEQFGYTPDYPTANQLYFDTDNRPYVVEPNGDLRTRAEGAWSSWNLARATVSPAPGRETKTLRPVGTKIAFDKDNDLYLLAAAGRNVALLHSSDGGKTFSAYGVAGREERPRSWDIEQFSGHNVPDHPPPFLRNTQTQGRDPRNFWRRVNDLELFVPRKDGDRIVIGEPILLSKQAIGIASHSGVPSSIVSRGNRIHVIWGEATDPNEDVPGVPAYVVTYDREQGLLGPPEFVGWGPPPNDVHNTPSLTIDSEGYLHTLTGTHGRPFAYARSRKPNTAHGGFTAPQPVEPGLRSTYIGFVCGADDALHLVFRVWTDDGVYHPSGYYANLGYMRKPKGRSWEPMRRLVVAPFSEYSIFYHRLTIDRKGRLFVSLDYWSTYWFYRTDHVGDRRKTIFSSDGGETWKLLETSDL